MAACFSHGCARSAPARHSRAQPRASPAHAARHIYLYVSVYLYLYINVSLYFVLVLVRVYLCPCVRRAQPRHQATSAIRSNLVVAWSSSWTAVSSPVRWLLLSPVQPSSRMSRNDASSASAEAKASTKAVWTFGNYRFWCSAEEVLIHVLMDKQIHLSLIHI